ncbi:nucleotidyltransferase [bacterium]|nr:nucleotidyltransferase [bacterium]
MFEEILSRIGKILKEYGLPYMIIGGQAVLLYGEPRLTRDIDITLGVNLDRLEDILAVVQKLSLQPLPENIEDFVQQTMVLPTLDEITGIRVDFIFSFTPYETGAIKRSNRIAILGEDVSFASAEDVIIHKVFSGRPRDMEDVVSIIRKNQDIDKNYIRDWLIKFDESSGDKRFLKTFELILKDSK